jgi:serine/threonine protein kinase
MSLPHDLLMSAPPARHIPTGQIVALKKVRFERGREGLPVTSVRELAILQAARHPNIVQLLRVVTGHRPDRWVSCLLQSMRHLVIEMCQI